MRTMLRVLAVLSLATSAEAASPPCPVAPERVFLGAVASNVFAYLDRVVEVCGLVQEVGERDPRERILHEMSPIGTGYWIYVYNEDHVLPPEGTRGCVVGTPRRRDGLTPEQAEARGLPNVGVADGLQRPDYVFYPVRCEYDAPALG